MISLLFPFLLPPFFLWLLIAHVLSRSFALHLDLKRLDWPTRKSLVSSEADGYHEPWFLYVATDSQNNHDLVYAPVISLSQFRQTMEALSYPKIIIQSYTC